MCTLSLRGPLARPEQTDRFSKYTVRARNIPQRGQRRGPSTSKNPSLICPEQHIVCRASRPLPPSSLGKGWEDDYVDVQTCTTRQRARRRAALLFTYKRGPAEQAKAVSMRQIMHRIACGVASATAHAFLLPIYVCLLAGQTPRGRHHMLLQNLYERVLHGHDLGAWEDTRVVYPPIIRFEGFYRRCVASLDAPDMPFSPM